MFTQIDETKMKKLINLAGVILVLVALLLVGKVVAEFKALSYIGKSAEVRNTISVTGTGTLAIIPNVAEFDFAVSHEAATVVGAQERVSEDMSALLSYLDEFGVEDKNIKTTNYSISPRYEYPEIGFGRGGSRVLVGYEVSQWVEIKLTETERLGEVIGALGDKGATNISNVRFTVEDEEEVKQEARRLAIENAQEKAKVLAKDLGVHLDEVVSFNEAGSPLYYPEAYALDSAVARGGSATPEIPVGESEFESNVTIHYSIR